MITDSVLKISIKKMGSGDTAQSLSVNKRNREFSMNIYQIGNCKALNILYKAN